MGEDLLSCDRVLRRQHELKRQHTGRVVAFRYLRHPHEASDQEDRGYEQRRGDDNLADYQCVPYTGTLLGYGEGATRGDAVREWAPLVGDDLQGWPESGDDAGRKSESDGERQSAPVDAKVIHPREHCAASELLSCRQLEELGYVDTGHRL